MSHFEEELMDLGIDLDIYFQKYQMLIKEVDQVFNKMKNDYPQEVKCDQGCTECCFALFDLSLVEALYLNKKFSDLGQDLRNSILIEADKTDRQINKIKKELYKEHRQGVDQQEILKKASLVKSRCPLLIDNICVLYDHRPITCRLYGIPMNMGQVTATCSQSGFETGKEYPTVHMNKIHDRLVSLSRETAEAINTRYPELYAMLVPVSMCILTDYNKEYLGVKKDESDSAQRKASKDSPTREWVLGPKE
jgi:Fe-S-cluster containining protein